MLRITVELVPFGNEDNKRILNELEIWNTGLTTKGGNSIYDARLINELGEAIAYREDIEHIRGIGYWILIQKVLRQLQLME